MEKELPLEEQSIKQIYLDSQGKKTYVIPVYQRNYAWEEDEIATLIKDVYDSYVSNVPYYYIGTLVSREERVARIDRRLDERLAGGMIEEVKGLLDSGIMAEDLVYYGLEYKFVTQYVLGILTFEEMRTLLANAIHQFAKRQMTWFRGMEKDNIKIHWTEVL